MAPRCPQSGRFRPDRKGVDSSRRLERCTHIFTRLTLALQPIKHDDEQMKFWSAIVRATLIVAVLAFVALSVWDQVFPYGKPIYSLHTLDGCYEGQGLPDFIRPRRHWTLIIANGMIVDRDGRNVAKIRLGRSEANMTPVTFTPGILIAGKPSTVLVGETVAGKAFIKRNVASIAVADDWGNVIQKTSCD